MEYQITITIPEEALIKIVELSGEDNFNEDHAVRFLDDRKSYFTSWLDWDEVQEELFDWMGGDPT
ncbi:MAG: hypothetical protein AAB875_01895 [Patescibacteria group bacterium]